MVHLHGEHLPCARVRGRVSGQEHNLLTWLHNTLLHTACQHIAHTLDLVDTRDGHAHWGTGGSLRNTEEVVEHILQSVHMHSLLADHHIHALPPAHIVRLLQQVVTHPARDGHHWSVLFNKILLPANLDQGALHLVADLVVTRLLVPGNIAVHLAHTHADLLHTQQVDQASMLTGLTLDLSGLVVTLRDG